MQHEHPPAFLADARRVSARSARRTAVKIRLTLILAAPMSIALAQAPPPTVQAKVVAVTPYISQELVPKAVEKCRDVQEVTRQKESHAPSIVGAVVGAAVGSSIGRGRGKSAATVAGAGIGAAVGSNNTPVREHVVVKKECDPVVEYDRQELTRYLVTYELQGQKFETTTDSRPGPTIPIVLKP
jgi:uncharacterized protein YcfJ